MIYLQKEENRMEQRDIFNTPEKAFIRDMWLCEADERGNKNAVEHIN